MAKKTDAAVEAQVIQAYQAEPAGGRTLARRFGIGGTTLYRMLKRNGVAIVEEKRNARLVHRFALSTKQEQEVIARTNTGERSPSIAKHFGISKYTVLAILQRHGVVTAIGKPKRVVAAKQLAKVAKLYAKGLSQEKIAKRFKVSQPTVSQWLRLQGISKHARPSGDQHGSWRGGRHQIKKTGYMLVWLASDDPMRSMALVNGYVMEHRLVVARSLGRPLLPTETVHHMNGKQDDNRLENLQLRQGKHGKGTAWVCADCGSHNIRASTFA